MGTKLNQGITQILKLRPEILELIKAKELKDISSYDVSPNLYNVAVYYEYSYICRNKTAHRAELGDICRSVNEAEAKWKTFIDPSEFFKRTYLSDNMDDIIVKTFASLIGGTPTRRDGTKVIPKSRIIILPSLMGGGKTHLLITLYHIIRLYNDLVVEKNKPEEFRNVVKLLDESLAERLYNMVKNVAPRRIRLAVIDGTSYITTPDPNKPVRKVIILRQGGIEETKTYAVHTMWGAIAHYLGNYQALAKRDESNTIPSREEMNELFSGDPFLIMVDEPQLYVNRYGDREKLRDFFQVLAVSIKESTNGLLIVSIPVAPEEVTARSFAGVVKEIYEVLARAQPELEVMPPLKPADIVKVLKIKLFENSDEDLRRIGQEIAKEVVSKGGNVVKSAVEALYGSVKDFEREMSESYPFNPQYIKLLEKYFANLTYLQRTRDAIRISIMALKAIYSGKYRNVSGDFYVISPHHIPIDDDSVRSYLANPNLDDFQTLMTMYDSDVVKASEKMGELSWLARIVASYIWLETLVGRGNLDEKALRLYPTINDVILAVYDPAVFSYHNAGAGSINDILDENSRNSLMANANYLFKLENKYFMAAVPPLDTIVKRIMERISDVEVSKKLHTLIEELFPKDEGQKKATKVFKHVYVIGIENRDATISKIKEEMKEDDSPILVVFSYEPTSEEIDSLLLRNNMVVAIPDMSGNIGERSIREELTEMVKQLIALEELSSREVLERYYSSELADAKSRQIKGKIGNTRTNVREMLGNNIYRKIIIGRAKKEVNKPLGSATVGTGTSGVNAIENILIDEGFIPSNYALSKDDVLLILSKLGKTCKDEVSSTLIVCKEVDVGDAWNWFQTTVEPPLNSTVVDFDGFLNGIKELYEETLSIAFTYGSEFAWKKVRDGKPEEPVDKGDWALVENFAKSMGVTAKMLKIVPYTDVVNRFLNNLKAESGVKEINKVKKVVKIMVTYKDALGNRVDEELERFIQEEGATTKARIAVFWKIEEYPDYVFMLDVTSIDVEGKQIVLGEQIKMEPGKKIFIKYRVDATEYPYGIEVKVSVDGSAISQKSIAGNQVFEDVVDYTPDKPGEHSIVIEAMGGDPKHYRQSKTVLVYIIGEIVEEKWVDVSGLRNILNESIYKKVALTGLSISDVILVQEILKELKEKGYTRVKEARLNNVEFEGGENKESTIKISAGKLTSIDDLRFIFDTVTRRFKQKSGIIEIDYEKIEDKKAIEELVDIFEKLQALNTKFKVEIHRAVS